VPRGGAHKIWRIQRIVHLNNNKDITENVNSAVGASAFGVAKRKTVISANEFLIVACEIWNLPFITLIKFARWKLYKKVGATCTRPLSSKWGWLWPRCSWLFSVTQWVLHSTLYFTKFYIFFGSLKCDRIHQLLMLFVIFQLDFFFSVDDKISGN